MKKIIIITITVILVLALAGCSSKYSDGGLSDAEVDTFEGASLEIQEGTVNPTSLKATVINETGYELEAGNEYCISIEELKDDGWHELKLSSELLTTSEAYGFPNGKKSTMDCIWEGSYGALPKGHYRIVKAMWTWDESKEGPEACGDTFFLSAEFDID